MKIRFQNEHTAENGKSEYIVLAEIILKKNIESGHWCDLKHTVFQGFNSQIYSQMSYLY